MIVASLANLIKREHEYCSLRNVLTLGKQDLRIKGFASDKDYFKSMGSEVTTIDIQNADIIHNLNYPVDKGLYEKFDFILDGGTFDHLFDIKTAFENVVKMLRPGGRVLHMNAASNFTGASYLSFSPEFFYDYYAVNRFPDVRVYLAEVDRLDQEKDWDLYEYEIVPKLAHFISSRIQMTICLAEKGKDSTFDKMPVQAQYGKLKQKYLSPRSLPTVKGIEKNGYRFVGRI